MTLDKQWKLAKWLKRHGISKRSEVPSWVPQDLLGPYAFFHVYCENSNSNGYPVIGGDDKFCMTDKDLDAYQEERRRRIHEFRDWLEPVGVVFATIISLIALIVSIIALVAGA